MKDHIKKIGLAFLFLLPVSTASSADLVVSVEAIKDKDAANSPSSVILAEPSLAVATFRHKHYPCFIGRCGATKCKIEGDGKTPVGSFPLRYVFYRPDKFSRGVMTGLPQKPLTPRLGWCDDPTSVAYNKLVKLPFSARHEVLWRSDDLYDVIVVVGYNDQPVRKGKGSAVFIHVAGKNTVSTAGCIAFSKAHLLEILRGLDRESRVVVILNSSARSIC